MQEINQIDATKPNQMTSYNSNGRSKNIKNTKIKPTIYMVILIVVTMIIMTKTITLMKTATKTVIII